GDDDVEVASFDMAHRLVDGLSADHLVLAAKDAVEEIEHVDLVVHDEKPRAHRSHDNLPPPRPETESWRAHAVHKWCARSLTFSINPLRWQSPISVGWSDSPDASSSHATDSRHRGRS